MIIRDLINKIEEDFPVNSSLSYDNSGANIIDFEGEIKGVTVCLDVTIDAIGFAQNNNTNLIISHHPIIFNNIKRINDDPVSKRIKLLNKYDISAYSCHTNYDVNIERGMGYNLLRAIFNNNDIFLHEYLESFVIGDKKYAIGDVITLKDSTTLQNIILQLKNKLSLDEDKISCYEFKKNIKKIVVIPGSGSSDIDLVIKNKPDLLITSDLKHNNIVDLMDEKISYINATHYGLEKVFIDAFTDYLYSKFNNLNVNKYFCNL